MLKYIFDTSFYLQLIFLLEAVVIAMTGINSYDFWGQCNSGLATQQQWPWTPGGWSAGKQLLLLFLLFRAKSLCPATPSYLTPSIPLLFSAHLLPTMTFASQS